MILESLAHQTTDFELDRLPCGNVNTFESLGILRHSRGTFLDLENTEITELESVALTQLVDDLIEECLNRSLDIRAFLLRRVCDSVDEIFFCCRSHQSPLSL